MPDNETFVIVGAGLAGGKAAEHLREEGFSGRLILLGDEPERPYERPPLSKDYLRGESPREKAYVHEAGFYSEHAIELRTETSAVRLEAHVGEVVLASGERVAYDRLLVATGAEPRRLELPGSELEGIYYLRSFADADALRGLLAGGGRLVVIGGGWIGAEVAASARKVGLEVAIVEPNESLLERALGRTLGAFYAEVHRSNGVELYTHASPARFEGSGRVERVVLQDGRELECAAVVVGIGASPRVGVTEGAGILVENGIIATKELQTSVPGIYVAGDAASAHHPFYGRRIRVEHWANALNQPAVAARAMLGKPAAYDRLPYFFSDQYEIGMEFTGDAAGSDELVVRGDPDGQEFIAFWLSRGRVVAGMNVNVWDVTDPIKALITSRRVVDRGRLLDPDVPLAELVEQGQPEAVA